MAIAPLNREEILAGHFLLRHLRPEELSRVAASATLVRHRPQATIFQKGDASGSMMAVVRGRVKICAYSADGKELVLNIIDRGSLFGEIALLDGEPRSADAVAIEETELLVLERNRLMPFLNDFNVDSHGGRAAFDFGVTRCPVKVQTSISHFQQLCFRPQLGLRDEVTDAGRRK